MQGEAARRVGEPSGDREEPSPEGLGSYDLLTQTEPRHPASQVMRQHLHRQPGSVGGEAARGEMIVLTPRMPSFICNRLVTCSL